MRAVITWLVRHLARLAMITALLGGTAAVVAATSAAASAAPAASATAQDGWVSASSEHTAKSVQLAAGTVHTIVVLDAPSGLKVDSLLDAAHSQTAPAGGAEAGLGGMASRPAGAPTAWLLTMAAGAVLTAAGIAGLRRSRPRLGADHS